ncbi:MAG: glucans biosynthesis glucosyltransferase MdoH [Dinoroseobacter sp.]|nr:glucans biosynthesis glucosyltransferase MdoH [Dinoroseobacter sp.]
MTHFQKDFLNGQHVVPAAETLSAASFPTAIHSATDAPRHIIRWRRQVFLLLNVATIAALFFAMAFILSYGGLIWVEVLMLGAYGLTLPWLSIGFWNSVIGFALSRKHGERAARVVLPALDRISGNEPITSRIAIVMPLRNENPSTSLARLQALQKELQGTGWGEKFDFHVLSDSDRDEIIQREEVGIAAWHHAVPYASPIYHRRVRNTGYKAGNIAEFLERSGNQYDFFLTLDADSLMGADTVLRLVRVMQVSPEIGLLQSLITGLPARIFFTRAFQFGMRQGMRSYTLGSAWWQADCGPNWGHNALIRTAPFHASCMLPTLPGHGPLSGDILSHDQLEACLMRRAGYQVRVLAEESESHEENPPSLADFMRRELRWCNGNLQYLRLLGLGGLQPVSRVQLLLAIQMYLAAPAWIAFIGLGAWLAAQSNQMGDVPLWAGLALFAVVMTMNLMPKLMGLGQVLCDPKQSAAWGGRTRVVLSGLCEIVFSMLIAPIVAFGLTLFAIGLSFGRRVGWEAQQRSRAVLRWSEAATVFWPQTLAGAVLTLWLYLTAPWALVFGAGIIAPLLLAIPIAVVSTLPSLNAWSLRLGLFDIPEDRRRTVAPECPSRSPAKVA